MNKSRHPWRRRLRRFIGNVGDDVRRLTLSKNAMLESRDGRVAQMDFAAGVRPSSVAATYPYPVSLEIIHSRNPCCCGFPFFDLGNTPVRRLSIGDLRWTYVLTVRGISQSLLTSSPTICHGPRKLCAAWDSRGAQ